MQSIVLSFARAFGIPNELTSKPMANVLNNKFKKKRLIYKMAERQIRLLWQKANFPLSRKLLMVAIVTAMILVSVIDRV